MARNRITFALLAVAILALAGCGGGGGGGRSQAQGEKEADVELVDNAIARELATADAYTAALRCSPASLCAGGSRRGAEALLRELRAQAQEHVDALTKALRGLGGAVDAEKVGSEREALDYGGVKGRDDFLVFAYERESRGVAGDLSEVAQLNGPWPRSLLGSIAANQAQHLVLLRRALGAPPLATVPEAFEAGTAPAP